METIKLFVFKMPYLCRFKTLENWGIFLEGGGFGEISPSSPLNQITLVCFPCIINIISLLFGKYGSSIKK